MSDKRKMEINDDQLNEVSGGFKKRADGAKTVQGILGNAEGLAILAEKSNLAGLAEKSELVANALKEGGTISAGGFTGI